MPAAIVFDDAHPRLAPLTDLRPSFDIRTGALTTLERLQRTLALDAITLCVPPHLTDLTRERHPHAVNVASRPLLILNGRWAVPDARAIASLAPGGVLVDAASGDLVAARPVVAPAGTLFADPRALAAHARESATSIQPAPAPALLDRPWRIRTFRDAALAADLELLRSLPSNAARPGVTLIGDAANLRIHPDATVSPSVVLDAEHGPIVIDSHATVRPGAIIVGPVYVGKHVTVLERTLIKANTAIGPSCKVAGEVGGTIFQGFANKAHDGHLGDSWVGEWANLGAGTTNSNLLNTYSEITARSASDAPNERTGETFLGAIIGDHAKFAICTRIMAGSVVHTGAMWAAAAPVSGPVDPFSWVTDQGKRGYRLDKFLEVARAVMARRKIEPSAAYLTRLRELHDRTTAGRAGGGA